MHLNHCLLTLKTIKMPHKYRTFWFAQAWKTAQVPYRSFCWPRSDELSGNCCQHLHNKHPLLSLEGWSCLVNKYTVLGFIAGCYCAILGLNVFALTACSYILGRCARSEWDGFFIVIIRRRCGRKRWRCVCGTLTKQNLQLFNSTLHA